MADLSQRLSTALAGRYRIERELGRGGMATVFLAEDLKHDRKVAIKVLDPEVAAAIGAERFVREIATVASLTHPHILPLHDSGVADGLLYYVMPYVAGESLRERLTREKQLAVEEALRIAGEVAGALEHAHGAGIVHRDVKPENVLLEAGHAVVADFGIARAVAGAGSDRLTATGIAVGTPAYMSPEQGAGSRALDGRSDVYSLGCVVYEMLAGEPPFTGPTAESVVFQHLNAAPPKVTALRPGVGVGIERALLKALAKTPADRHASAAAFAVALERGTEAEPGRRGARWASLSAVVAVVAYLAVAAWQSWWPFERPIPPAAKKDWILVAEFDSAPADTGVAMASHDLLSAALDQSRIVATVPRDQIRQGLRAAGKPVSARLEADLARELAFRSSVRAVLEGTIGRLGKGYSIVLRVVDADTARVLVTASGTAKNDDGLIPALGEMAKELRRGLGENRHALAATRPMNLVATPSFEAYRLFVQGGRRYGAEQGHRELLRYYRAALALDPEFASAWLGMAIPYTNLGYPDSARMCLNKALRWPERLTGTQRQRIEIFLATLDGDDRRVLAAYDRILADDPGNVFALGNSNDILCRLGRPEEALERTRKAMKLSPFGPSGVMVTNEARSLEWLGRFDEARESNRRQTGYWKVWLSSEIEIAAGRFAVAESIATANLKDPRMSQDWPEGMQGFVSASRFGRGALSSSRDALEAAIELCRLGHDPVGVESYHDVWMEWSVVSEGGIPLPPQATPHDTSARALLVGGLAAAIAGDQAVARRYLESEKACPRWDRAGDSVAVALLGARLAALAGHPEEGAQILRPFSTWFLFSAASLTWAHWWLADAFEQMGRPDSAAFYLERVQSIAFTPRDGAERPYVHCRLALLYAKLGRVADAERHLAAAEQAWDRPDPAVRRMLDEARVAVRGARGLARPAT